MFDRHELPQVPPAPWPSSIGAPGRPMPGAIPGSANSAPPPTGYPDLSLPPPGPYQKPPPGDPQQRPGADERASQRAQWPFYILILVVGFGLGASVVAFSDVAATGFDLDLEQEAVSDQEAPEEAIARYTEAIRDQPGVASLYALRAEAHYNNYDYEAAEADYNEAIRLDPDDAANYAARGDLLRWSDTEQSIADYTVAIELESKRASHYAGRAQSYETDGNDQDARDDYSKAIELAPKQIELYEQRATVLARLGDTEAAMADHDWIIDHDPSAYRYSNRANLHLELGDNEAAIADYIEADKLEPEYTYYLVLLAGAHQANDDPDAALEVYNTAIERDSGWGPYTDRGDLLWSMGRQDEAFADYATAIESGDLVANFKRGVARTSLGLWSLALTDLDEVVDGAERYGPDFGYDYGLDPAVVYYHRAVARAGDGDFDGAVSDLQKSFDQGQRVALPSFRSDQLDGWVAALENGTNPFSGES